MLKQKGVFWSQFEQISNENNENSEQWWCIHCGRQWVKNASHLKKHLESCKKYQDSVNQSAPLPLPPSKTKRKIEQQTTLDGYAYSFSQKDQEEMERLLPYKKFIYKIDMFCICFVYVFNNIII